MYSLSYCITNVIRRNNLQSGSHLKYSAIELVVRFYINREFSILSIVILRIWFNHGIATMKGLRVYQFINI